MNLIALAMPWWEFVLRATAVYVALLVMIRMAGKRTVGEFTPFDMVLLILLGNAVQNSLIGEDMSLAGGLILAATLIALNYVVGWVTARSARLHRVIEGEAVQVAEEGRVDYRKLRSEGVSVADFEEALRRSGIDSEAEIRAAWIETDGTITVRKAGK